MTYEPIQLSEAQIASFHEEGFLILENLIDANTVSKIRDRIEPLFAGNFETGIYPDEWHWRSGLSLPNVTREICNAWKCDRTVASLALSAEIGRLSAVLTGWSGARIGQDSIWLKPAGGGKEVALHQDGAYIDYINPPEMITFWIALDDTDAETGTLQYVRGSHKWSLLNQAGEFHAPQKDYRAGMWQAAAAAGVAEPEIVSVEIPAGGCAIHHGQMWHGSGKNQSRDRVRRSLGIHTLSSQAHFQEGVLAGYIYGRYKRVGDTTMDESFFPVLWRQDGYRSPHLANYCEDVLTESLATA